MNPTQQKPELNFFPMVVFQYLQCTVNVHMKQIKIKWPLPFTV